MPTSTVPRVLYLVHDLNDAAVAQRCRMLRDGGARVTLAGFYRGEHPPESVPGADVIYSFGRTQNGRFIDRMVKAVSVWICWSRYARRWGAVDIVIARNLEMLMIGHRAKRFLKNHSKLTYEVLDIHRLILGQGMVSRVLRRVEGYFLRPVDVIITSSPAFIKNYFELFHRTLPSVRLVENKIYDPDHQIMETLRTLPAEPSWVIGWFGVLRCRKSLILLRDAVRAGQGRVRVVLRGRPALDQIPDFHEIVSGTPGMNYGGPYKSPDDLSAIYGAVHFVWAIDLYEEGQNSSWLLPNRIYASGAYRVPPIVQSGVETERFARVRGIGVSLSVPMDKSLNEILINMTTEKYDTLAEAMARVPLSDFVAGRDDAAQLVAALQGAM